MISRERFDGFKAALDEHHLDFKPGYLKYCNHGGMIQDEVEFAIKELLNMDEPPDAIFIGSDRLTISCMHILKKMGIKIPDDMGIAGFTNSDVAELFDPPLTVVRQPAFQIGQMATEMLIKTIESKWPVEEFTTEQVETELIARSSSQKLH